jgi:hypothetical protein
MYSSPRELMEADKVMRIAKTIESNPTKILTTLKNLK